MAAVAAPPLRGVGLPTAFVDEDFAFYGRTPRGARGSGSAGSAVSRLSKGDGFAVGRNLRRAILPRGCEGPDGRLIANLVEAYRRNISDLEWMTPATRAKALAKLESFNPKIGYPAHWRDYPALLVDRGDLIGNVARAAAFENNREFAKIPGRPSTATSGS